MNGEEERLLAGFRHTNWTGRAAERKRYLKQMKQQGIDPRRIAAMYGRKEARRVLKEIEEA